MSQTPSDSKHGCITSVVVVTKDRPDALCGLLQSLTTQTQRPDEVVIIDNGSTRSNEAVLERYRQMLPLRCYKEPVPGIPAARNRGIKEARGDLVIFIDDDCEALPDWLENIVRPFATNPHIGAVGGEILSEVRHNSLIEEFCASEGLMAVGRREQ